MAVQYNITATNARLQAVADWFSGGNFLLNNGDATAADLEGLGEDVRRRVAESSGVSLHWEIKRIGIPA